MAEEQTKVTETPAQEAWLVEADWLAMQLKAVTAANVEVRFGIGDWLNKYADRDTVYDVGEEKFQKPHKQLVDYASTAKRMPESLRTFKLSFNHYRVVANSAPRDKFAYWLEYAERYKRNCEDLRQSILAGSEGTEKLSVVISAEAYETLESVAETHNSTVQELAGAWLQEKVKAELAIALKDTSYPADIGGKPSPWILQKRAEEAERVKQAQELHAAQFPAVPTAEFKQRWAAFLNADYLHKPLPTVHTVAERERQERVKCQEAWFDLQWEQALEEDRKRNAQKAAVPVAS